MISSIITWSHHITRSDPIVGLLPIKSTIGSSFYYEIFFSLFVINP